MKQDNTILSLTTDLLAYGGFSHLKDDEISALHHVLLRLQGSVNIMQQKLLLTFWNNADFNSIPASLLHRCNMILLQFGAAPMEDRMVQADMY
jgi:hypothetical protein